MSITKVYGSMVLQRIPLCLANLTEFENDYIDFKNSLEFTTSRGIFSLNEKTAKIEHSIGFKETEIKFENDKKILSRCPEKSLYLMLENNGVWEFPKSLYDQSHKDKESDLLNIAKDALDQSTGVKSIYCLGRKPIAVHIEKSETENSSIFFFLSQLLPGNFSTKLNHGWFTKKEVAEIIDPKIWNSVSLILSE